jgi:predicted RNase H-like HicB family nuclease
MITQYVDAALHHGRYEILEDGTYYGEVPPLRGVLATGRTLEACRRELAEVIEEWVLVRVAKGLAVPSIGSVGVRIKKAG